MADLYDLGELRANYSELKDSVDGMQQLLKDLESGVASIPSSDKQQLVIEIRRAIVRDVLVERTNINQAAREFSRAVTELQQWARSLEAE